MRVTLSVIARPLDAMARRILAHSRSVVPFDSSSPLVLVRSTSYGDLVTFLPFVAELTRRIGNGGVRLLLLSRHGPVGEALLGEDGNIPFDTFDASERTRFPREMWRIGRRMRRGTHGHVLFCGPAIDSPTRRLKRWLLVRALAGLRPQVRGFNFKQPVLRPAQARAAGGPTVVNQALLPFAEVGLAPSVDRAAVLAIVGLTPSERASAATLARHGGKVIGMCVGSRHARKRWPAERFAELANRLLRDTSLAIVFLGGAEDLPAISDVLRHVERLERVSVGAGVLSLRETIAFAPYLAACVGNDGATGHLCALGGSPVVSIFCDWEPPGIWEPIIAPASRSVRPTTRPGRVAGDYGIETISVAAVEDAVRELVNRGGGHDIIEVGERHGPTRRPIAGFPF
jgi:hypothetical protein